MSPQRKHEQSPEEHAAMFKFLDAYAGQTYSDDVGGLLGQLSQLRERATLDRPNDRMWHRAVSLAVTAH
jgi:hypothetical protein